MADAVSTTPPGMIRVLARIAADANRERDRVEGRAPTEHVEDRNWAMTDALSHFQAETIEEAAIQLAWAISVADIWANATTERADEERHHRALQRLLYSALHAVKREHQIDLHAAGYGPLDSDNTNPWRTDTEGETNRSPLQAVPTLDDFIEAHRVAHAEWLAAALRRDTISSKLSGQRVPPPELEDAEALLEATMRAEKDALLRLLEYRPKSLAEVQRRTSYLFHEDGVWDSPSTPDTWEIEPFLRSLSEEAA